MSTVDNQRYFPDSVKLERVGNGCSEVEEARWRWKVMKGFEGVRRRTTRPLYAGQARMTRQWKRKKALEHWEWTTRIAWVKRGKSYFAGFLRRTRTTSWERTG
jgi:hypothetical protein